MNRLRELRVRRGLTQAEFGKIFNASQNTVSNWEKGIRKIDNDHLLEFASFFSVSVDYLLGRADSYVPTQANTEKIQPAAKGDELDEKLISLLVDLSPSEVQRVEDFVAGLKASRKADTSPRK